MLEMRRYEMRLALEKAGLWLCAVPVITSINTSGVGL